MPVVAIFFYWQMGSNVAKSIGGAYRRGGGVFAGFYGTIALCRVVHRLIQSTSL